MKNKYGTHLINTLKANDLDPKDRLKFVLEILKQNIDPNTRDENGKPALIIAIQSPIEFGKFNIVLAFINAGADINQKFYIIGDSSLAWCSGEREREYFAEEGLTPLLAASILADVSILQLLLKHNANILATTANDADTPLVSYSSNDITKHEFGRDIYPQLRKRTALDLMLNLNSINHEAIEMLIENGCPISDENTRHIKRTPILFQYFNTKDDTIQNELKNTFSSQNVTSIVMSYLSRNKIKF